MNFNFDEDYILEDDVVRLRPLNAADFEQLLEYSINEPEIWKFNSGGAEGADNLRHYINTAVKNRQEQKEYPFIVFDKRVNKYIGSTRFYDIQFQRKIIQLGYTWYGKNFQGTGINKNCKYLLFDFAFTSMDMERVALTANSKNERSINAMKSIGCTPEGLLRSFGFDSKGNRTDSIVLSVIREEWQRELKEKLKARIVQQ